METYKTQVLLVLHYKRGEGQEDWKPLNILCMWRKREKKRLGLKSELG